MIFEHTCVKDNRDHLLLCQFGFACQRLFHQLINALDLASVAFVGAFHSVTILITDDVRPFFEWLGGYVVVAGGERMSASAPSGVLGTHRFFKIKIWSANAIFKALKKVVDGSSSRFERGKLLVGWIFVDGFLKLNFGICRFFDYVVHNFELLLERLQACIHSCKKVFSLQFCEAPRLIITTCEICPKCRSQNLQNACCARGTAGK